MSGSSLPGVDSKRAATMYALIVWSLCSATTGADADESLPRADDTPCPMATPSTFHLAYPERVNISPESIENFERYNQDGHGSIIVATRWDGTVKALVPPTLDIDPKLNEVLHEFVRRIVVSPTIDCGATTSYVMVHFAVPSGKISIFPMHAADDSGK